MLVRVCADLCRLQITVEINKAVPQKVGNPNSALPKEPRTRGYIAQIPRVGSNTVGLRNKKKGNKMTPTDILLYS